MNLLLSSLLPLLLGAAPSPPEPLCEGRPPCKVAKTQDAGPDAQGRPMKVVQLDLGWLSREYTDADKTRKFGPKGRSRREGGCKADEWWLVTPEAPSQLLFGRCNDGYGAGGMGEDTVTVKDGVLSHEQLSGGGNRMTVTRTLRLSPLRRLSESSENFFIDEAEASTATWDFTTLQGARSQVSPCAAGKASSRRRTLPLLARVQVDAAFLSEGWKQTGLGTCALEARNMVLGKLGGPEDASLKAVLADAHTLFLEVRDNTWTGPSGEQWLADDHVELWLGREKPWFLEACEAPEPRDRPVQWGLRLADGRVFPAYGSPKGTLGVERAEIRGAGGLEGYRLKLTLPGTFQGLSAVYSDSDSGQKQERMLATSPVKFARPETLGPIRDVPPSEATCQVRAGQLDVVQTPLAPPGPDLAVFPDN